MVVVAVAVLSPNPLKVKVGAVVYPNPGFSIFNVLIPPIPAPAKVMFAPLPEPPLTVGTAIYPLPPFSRVNPVICPEPPTVLTSTLAVLLT